MVFGLVVGEAGARPTALAAQRQAVPEALPPLVASRCTLRSDCPVRAAVSAVNAGAKLALAFPIALLAA